MLRSIQIIGLLFVLAASGCARFEKPAANFNPAAAYWTPPEGLWVSGLLYEVNEETYTRTGKMWVPPGVLIVKGEE